MPLANFGAILNFAETLESRDKNIFRSLADNPNCAAYKSRLEQFTRECEKNIKTIQRTRRENVTEMILEPIRNFIRKPYEIKCEGCGAMKMDEAIVTCKTLSQKAGIFYTTAAQQLKAQPEVGRALKRIGKRRQAQVDRL